MKRESRQHGMVRTYRVLPDPLNPRPESRFLNRLDSPPTAGLFTKVPSKPTNHSKFTDKCSRPRCSECHKNPARKAKDKSKGVVKLRSNDVVTNCKLVTWRVADARTGLTFSGISATGILDHLSNGYVDDYDVDDYDVDDYDIDDYDGIQHEEDEISQIFPEKVADNDDGDDDDATSYCDAVIIIEHLEEDEGWCLV